MSGGCAYLNIDDHKSACVVGRVSQVSQSLLQAFSANLKQRLVGGAQERPWHMGGASPSSVVSNPLATPPSTVKSVIVTPSRAFGPFGSHPVDVSDAESEDEFELMPVNEVASEHQVFETPSKPENKLPSYDLAESSGQRLSFQDAEESPVDHTVSMWTPPGSKAPSVSAPASGNFRPTTNPLMGGFSSGTYGVVMPAPILSLLRDVDEDDEEYEYYLGEDGNILVDDS